jgi:hypothetical protein
LGSRVFFRRSQSRLLLLGDFKGRVWKLPGVQTFSKRFVLSLIDRIWILMTSGTIRSPILCILGDRALREPRPPKPPEIELRCRWSSVTSPLQRVDWETCSVQTDLRSASNESSRSIWFDWHSSSSTTRRGHLLTTCRDCIQSNVTVTLQLDQRACCGPSFATELLLRNWSYISTTVAVSLRHGIPPPMNSPVSQDLALFVAAWSLSSSCVSPTHSDNFSACFS